MRNVLSKLLWLTLWAILAAGASPSPVKPSESKLSRLVEQVSRRGQNAITQAVPALNTFHGLPSSALPSVSSSSAPASSKRLPLSLLPQSLEKVIEVSTKRVVKKSEERFSQVKNMLTSAPVSELTEKNGFYYGISSETYSSASKRVKRMSLSDSMAEALEELRLMRQEMENLQRDMNELKSSMIEDGDDSLLGGGHQLALSDADRKKRQKEFATIHKEVEAWAERMLDETEQDGWKEVACNKMMKGQFNKLGSTKAYLKWMKDSRGGHADSADEAEYPCIKCYSTIDAPLEDVCAYLSQEQVSSEYNDVVEKNKDIEEITPDGKICWSKSPQILFLKPRDFVTYCHHRWLRDGTQVMINQACDHPAFPGVTEDKGDKACRAYALRGVNYISRHPADPTKTQIIILAHANPGGNVPQWAVKTAINALAPIEPFKLFAKINDNVKRRQPELRERMNEAETVASGSSGRSSRPAGMAQLGYACFWPNGGGMQEGGLKSTKAPSALDENGAAFQELEQQQQQSTLLPDHIPTMDAVGSGETTRSTTDSGDSGNDAWTDQTGPATMPPMTD